MKSDMDCEELIKVTVALQIMQMPEDRRLPKLFNCIYSSFQGSFINWILNKYSGRVKDKLWEDAKDAFQNGVIAFYQKAQRREFAIKGSLKTTVFSFGFLQLLANFKKEKPVYGTGDETIPFDVFFEDDFLEYEMQKLLNEKEYALMEALNILTGKQKDIIVMKFFDRLKSKQIAEKLNVTVGYVDNVSTKAYKELREILKSKFSIQKQIL